MKINRNEMSEEPIMLSRGPKARASVTCVHYPQFYPQFCSSISKSITLITPSPFMS